MNQSTGAQSRCHNGTVRHLRAPGPSASGGIER